MILDNYTQPRKASDIAGTLEGTQKDYTVLMHSLMQSIHIDSRVVFSYSGDLLRYYPEVLATNTSSGYTAVVQELNTRYGVTSPKGHSDDTGYWIALGMGDLPGDPAGWCHAGVCPLQWHDRPDQGQLRRLAVPAGDRLW